MAISFGTHFLFEPYPTLGENFRTIFIQIAKLEQRIHGINEVTILIISQETEKVALAETTGLDQKQINNWFINQRKRHWKPSEDMQFMVMDGLHPQNAALYMESHYMGDGAYRLGP